MDRHAAIYWKMNNVPGISIVGDTIRDWPAVLGPKPTEQQITAWVAEYEIYVEEQKKLKEDQDAVELLIQTKLRDQAIAELKKEGKLTANGKIKK